MEDARLEEARFRRDRVTVTALVAVMVCGLLAYTVAAASTARELRNRNALDRNVDTARLCARLLDEQCDSALYVLKALAKQPLLADRLSGRAAPQFATHLHDAVELVPDLQAAAICDPQGKVRASYPPDIPFPPTVTTEPWFREATDRGGPAIGDALRLKDTAHTEVFPMIFPVRERAETDTKQPSRIVGCLIAYYRLGDIYGWLREVHVNGGSIVLVNAAGLAVASSGPYDLSTFRANGPVALALTQARQGNYGAALLGKGGDETGQGIAVVGYAHSARTGWSLLIVQPSSAAFAPTDFLLQRFILVSVPLVLLVPLCAWALLTLYHRQQQLTRLLTERNTQLQRADRAKSDILANVSHDLKTPIASMRLSLSGLLPERSPDAPTDPAQVRDCLSVMSDGLEQLSARVRNLLDMARLESGGVAGALEPRLIETADMADVAGAALECLRLRLRGRFVDARFPPEPLLVECDQSQMQTVLVNLLENALRYSPPGSPIHLTGYREGAWVVLRLRDEGPGIPLAERNRVFEKFYRAANPYAPGGTGLGLAICRSVVEAHGGTIAMGEGVEGGAEVILRLPRITEDADNSASVGAAR